MVFPTRRATTGGRRGRALAAGLVLGLAGCGAAAPAPAPLAVPTSPSASPPAATPSAGSSPTDRPATTVEPAGGDAQRVTKVLVVVEENHSLDEMRSQMPYLAGLAKRFGYADHYTGIRHPSLPNYLAIAGGDTFGVADDAAPADHALQGPSIFSQARDAGLSAGSFEDAMTQPCQLTPDGSTRYAAKHNPWAYFADDRPACRSGDLAARGFVEAARADALPNVSMLIPNTCHDAHDGDEGCTLPGADAWLRSQLPAALESHDFTSGALAVVVTADEDDHSSGNTVLTVVAQAGLDGSGTVVSTPLTHYSLSRFCSEVVGAEPLRHAADAPDLAEAFHLPVRA